MWYQEHLLRMEDVLGRKMEAKIEELLDRNSMNIWKRRRKESEKSNNIYL